MSTHYNFSIITVNYNSGDLLSNLITSIYDHIDHSFEVIVIDNCSSDNSVKLLRSKYKHKDNLKILINQTNTGFSYANNQGAEIANGRFLHFLNPDTIVSHDLNKLYSEILIDCKDAIYVTSLKDFEGNELKSKQKIPTLTNYYNCLFRKGKIQYWYTGASLVMSSKVFDKIEKWNTNYFLYSEDLDLFYKAYMHEITILYVDTKIVHIEKGCSTNVWNNFQRELRVQKSFKQFFKLNRTIFEYYLVLFVILVYTLMRNPRMFIFYIKVLYYLSFKRNLNVK